MGGKILDMLQCFRVDGVYAVQVWWWKGKSVYLLYTRRATTFKIILYVVYAIKHFKGPI